MTSLIPKVLQDESNLALEKCAAKAFDKDLKPLMIYAIDHLEEKYLYLMAEFFHILGDEGWNFARTIKEKRKLLKNARILHSYKGTKFALKRVLEILNFEGDIQEWQKYDGIPHHFRVILKVFDRNLDDETEDLLLRLINTFKNERAKLDTIEMYLCTRANMHTYCRLLIGEVITIKAKRGN